MRAFVRHLLGDVPCSLSYQESVGKWLVKIGRADRTLSTVTWGTQDYPANELIEAILSNRSIQVKREDGEDEHGRPVYRVDEGLTAAANQKADEIRQAFLDWIWEDKDRRESLARLYNDRFNTNVAARFDGSHLLLPGSSLGVELRPSQKDAIWRGIQEGNVLYDHVVGAGKTYVLVGVLMESRRMGFAPEAHAGRTEPPVAAVEGCVLCALPAGKRARRREDRFPEGKPRAPVWAHSHRELGRGDHRTQLVQEDRDASRDAEVDPRGADRRHHSGSRELEGAERGQGHDQRNGEDEGPHARAVGTQGRHWREGSGRELCGSGR